MGALQDFLKGNRSVNLSNVATAAIVLTPSWVLSLVAPWFEPFKKLELIHPLWRPEIDIAADAIAAVVGLLGYMYLRGCQPLILRRIAMWAGVFFVGLLAACTIIRSQIRHVDAEFWIDAVQFLWGVFYILSFSALAICVIAFLVWVILTEDIPKGPGQEHAGTLEAENGHPPE